jgi:hypothetical protein
MGVHACWVGTCVLWLKAQRLDCASPHPLWTRSGPKRPYQSLCAFSQGSTCTMRSQRSCALRLCRGHVLAASSTRLQGCCDEKRGRSGRADRPVPGSATQSCTRLDDQERLPVGYVPQRAVAGACTQGDNKNACAKHLPVSAAVHGCWLEWCWRAGHLLAWTGAWVAVSSQRPAWSTRRRPG